MPCRKWIHEATENRGSRAVHRGQEKYNNAALYLLIGRTGVITARSTTPGMDWSVEMDEGCYDLDAAANTLEPIDDDHADNWTAEKREHEAA